MANRCDFNKPYSFIELFSGQFSDYAPLIEQTSRYIVWLDYDWGISPNTQSDVVDLGSVLPPDSFAFVTVKAEPSGDFRDMSPEERLEAFREAFGDFAAELEVRHVTNSRYRDTTAMLVSAFVQYAFASRSAGIFVPLIKTLYRDSTWMVTVGGFFGAEDIATRLQHAIFEDMPFLRPAANDKFYEIPQLNVTDHERKLLDLYATSDLTSNGLRRRLAQLGFSGPALKEYSEMFRFLPRYFESYI